MESSAVEFVEPDIECGESALRWAVAYPAELTGVRRLRGTVDGLADWGQCQKSQYTI